jgi:hypothetical protein
MAYPAIPLAGSFRAPRPTRSSSAWSLHSRCTAGCPSAPVIDPTAAQIAEHLLLRDRDPALSNHGTVLI